MFGQNQLMEAGRANKAAMQQAMKAKYDQWNDIVAKHGAKAGLEWFIDQYDQMDNLTAKQEANRKSCLGILHAHKRDLGEDYDQEVIDMGRFAAGVNKFGRSNWKYDHRPVTEEDMLSIVSNTMMSAMGIPVLKTRYEDIQQMFQAVMEQINRSPKAVLSRMLNEARAVPGKTAQSLVVEYQKMLRMPAPVMESKLRFMTANQLLRPIGLRGVYPLDRNVVRLVSESISEQVNFLPLNPQQKKMKLLAESYGFIVYSKP